MSIMLRLAEQGDYESFAEGTEDGYWAGYRDGMEQMRRYIVGERLGNPGDDIPEEFGPLGNRWLSRTERA